MNPSLFRTAATTETRRNVQTGKLPLFPTNLRRGTTSKISYMRSPGRAPGRALPRPPSPGPAPGPHPAHLPGRRGQGKPRAQVDSPSRGCIFFSLSSSCSLIPHPDPLFLVKLFFTFSLGFYLTCRCLR